MSAHLLLTAAIYTCLAAPAISTFIIHPRKHFGVPPGKIIMPGKMLKFPGKHMIPMPMPRPGPFIMRPHPKPFMFVKKGPIHPFLLHKMKKMKKMRMFVLPPNMHKFGKSRRGPFRGMSIRPTGYSRRFISMGHGQSKGRRGGFGKHGRFRPGARKGGYGGRRPMKTYGNKQHGGILGDQLRGMPLGQGFSQTRGGFRGGFPGNNFRTLNDLDVFDDQFDDRFESDFNRDDGDDRFNADFGLSDDKRNDDGVNREFEMEGHTRGDDRDFRNSLFVPDMFDANTEENRHFNMDMKQLPHTRGEFDDKKGDQDTAHDGFGMDGDKFGSMQPGYASQGDSGFNPFNIQPGFLDGHTGVNTGGGIGLLQNFNERADDRFDDKSRSVSVDISVNAMDPFSQHMGSFGGMTQGSHMPQKHDAVGDAGTAGFPTGGFQAGVHGVPHTGDVDTKDADHGLQHQPVSTNHAIDGLELLGNSHPNMIANSFLNVEMESDLQRTHPSNLQVLPFNPHSDETMNGKDGPSSADSFDEGSLSLLGIDPRTLQPGMQAGQFGMQQHQQQPGAGTAGEPVQPGAWDTVQPGTWGTGQHAQFPMHQPAQLPMQQQAQIPMHQPAQLPMSQSAQFPQETQFNMNNPGSFSETFPGAQFPQDAFNQHHGMQHGMQMSFPPTSQTHPQSSMGHAFTPDDHKGGIGSQTFSDIQMDEPIQFHSQLSMGHAAFTPENHDGTSGSQAFQDIQMNADLFQDFGLLDNTQVNSVDHSGQGSIGQVPSLEQLQFGGDAGKGDDMSILSQFPSVDDLNFGMDNFKSNGHEAMKS